MIISIDAIIIQVKLSYLRKFELPKKNTAINIPKFDNRTTNTIHQNIFISCTLLVSSARINNIVTS